MTRILRRFARYNSPFEKEDLFVRYPFPGLKLEKILSRLAADGTLIYSEERGKYFHATIYDRAARLSANMAADEIKSRSPGALAMLLFDWQKLAASPAAPEEQLYEVITQLEGLYLPADAWESIVFPARITGYGPAMLDRLCASGRVVWRILDADPKNQFKLAWFKAESISFEVELKAAGTGLPEEQAAIYTLLLRKGATFTHVLTSLSGKPAGELLDVLRELALKGLVVNDSFQPLRFFMNREAFDALDPMQKARKIAMMVSRMEMGRWEPAYPPRPLTMQEFIQRCGQRYGMITKEIVGLEEGPWHWPEVYEALKQMEFAGDIQRGYFFTGISGIQFMVAAAAKRLETEKPDHIVLNACDPAQPYGRIIPQAEHDLPFTCVPGTAIVMSGGKPVLLLERNGDKVSFDAGTGSLEEAVIAFAKAFQEKRLWPDRKRIAVKYWPEDPQEKEKLQSALTAAGFMPEIDKMVLWRSV
jgi:ATP-dependent Lhr-like helicase